MDCTEITPSQPYGYVYLVTNTVNGKVYVGQTTRSVKKRWAEHQAATRRGCPLPFHCAIRKYGCEVFTHTELEQCPNKLALCQAEAKWVGAYNSTTAGNGYNCTSGGEIGYEWTSESRQRLSEAQKERMSDPAERRRVAKAQKQYLEDHPEEILRLTEQSRQYNGSAEGRAELSRVMYENLAKPGVIEHYVEGQQRRCATPEGRAHILSVATIGRATGCLRWDARRGGAWTTEEEVHKLIQGLTVKGYNLLRKSIKTLPKQSQFPRIYGKTFKEVRDGCLRDLWAAEEVTRQAIQGVSLTVYENLRKDPKFNPPLPWPGEFPRLYGKTFKEVRDGYRGKNWDARKGLT